MKILKKASQKNVILNKNYYTQGQINEMLYNKEIFYFDEHFEPCYEQMLCYQIASNDLRIFTENLSEIKVELDDIYHYTNVAVGKNGKKYFVAL